MRAKLKENLAKQNAESKKRSTMRETSAAEGQQNRAESILEHQTGFEVEFHIDEERLQRPRTRFEQWRIHLKRSSSKHRSVETVSKFNLQRAQELTRTQREDGKQDARKGHAQVAWRVRTRHRTPRSWTG